MITAFNQRISTSSTYTVPAGKLAEFYIQPLPVDNGDTQARVAINDVHASYIERLDSSQRGPFFANAGDVISYVGNQSVAISGKLTDAA